MTPRKSINPAPACVLCAAAFFLLPAAAGDEGLAGLAEKSQAAMNAENWQEALDLTSRAVERFGKNDPLESFGAQFGALYFRKGVCEMKLKKWDEAMRSFEICYRDFPNNGADKSNVFQKMALLKWGEAAMALEKWELAVSQFRKFIEERDKLNDRFARGAFYINMAVCHYRLGAIPAGNENLEIAINNKERFPTPESGIVAGFEALVGAAILKQNEQALLDFIAKNRGELILEPYPMHRYSRVFMKLAGDAITADMRRAALALYQFVPSTETALDDARARLRSSGNPVEKKALENDIAGLETELAGRNSPEMIRLAAVAFLHEKSGNLRGAFAAYQQLETCFPNAENREENLYNLVRTSSLVPDAGGTREYAETFIRDFPNSPHANELRRMMQ